jgi:hypothetical protein
MPFHGGVPDSHLAWAAAYLERLGVPSWGIVPRTRFQRLDLDRNGVPDANSERELEFQKDLRVILDRAKLTPVPTLVITDERSHNPPAAKPRSALPFSDDLREVIFLALDSEMPGAITIQQTNERLKGLLGTDIWSGRRYEDGSHKEEQGRCWYRMRDIALNQGSHSGLMRAHIQVPLGYFHPDTLFPTMTGSAPVVVQQIPSSIPIAVTQPVAPGLWYRLYARPLPLDTDVTALVTQYRSKGLLAYKSVTTTLKERGMQLNKAPKAMEVHLLFKLVNQRDAALQALRGSMPNLDVRSSDVDPDQWRSEYTHFYDEGYIRQLFADPRPVEHIKKLLALAPASIRPVNTREAAPTMAVDIEKARQKLIADMLETSRYPPLTRNPLDPPTLPRVLQQYWCTSDFLHALTQAPRPHHFSEMDDMCLKRMSLFLLLLAEFPRPSFRISLYNSRFGQYRRLMKHVTMHIETAVEAKSSSCGISSKLEPGRSVAQGAKESNGAEFIQYHPKESRFVIVLDPDRDAAEYVPTQKVLDDEAKAAEGEVAKVVAKKKASKG